MLLKGVTGAIQAVYSTSGPFGGAHKGNLGCQEHSRRMWEDVLV